jgi:hypothetical protein
MTMREQFPRTSARFANLLEWDVDFDWSRAESRLLALQLVTAQNSAFEQSESGFFDYCATVADDVGALAPIDEISPAADTIDLFRFLFALKPMEITLVFGQNGDCYGWIMWALARDCDRSARFFDVSYSFFPPDSQAADDYHDLALANLPRWTHSFFLLARKFGGLDEVAISTAKICWMGCNNAFLSDADSDDCFAGLISLANWAVNANAPQAERWVRILAGMWDKPIPDRTRAHIGILMITSAHRFTDRGLQEWARELLGNYRHLLTEHMLLQVLAVTAETREDWLAHRDEIIAAAADLARWYRENAADPSGAMMALESRVSIIHPLVYSLTEHGTVDDILDLLGAWYVIPNGRTNDSKVLIIATSHRHGVGYLWGGERLIIRREDEQGSFERMMEAASNAQRDFHRVGGVGDRFPQIDYDRLGQPDENAAPQFETAVRAHFELALLAEELPKGLALRSTLSIPALPIPLGALLAKETDAPVAQEVSLLEPLPNRPIRKVSVWLGSTLHAAFELEALQSVAGLADWELEVVDRGDDPKAFLEFYASEAADLLWVIGHGEHSPYRLEDSGIVIGDGLVTADMLSEITFRSDGRRLLVLNVCSGAATQVRGGMARIGLSHELVTPQQRVIAHLWPIGMYSGLAFGSKLALELAGSDTDAAYRATIRGMTQPYALCEELRLRLGENLGIHDRIANQHEQIGGFLSWGSPVLLT